MLETMFEVVVSDRFARWYELLPEPEAEEVALALDVAAALGSAPDPVRGRRLMLWFDGVSRQGASRGSAAEQLVRNERYLRLLWWGRRVRQCLESAALQRRLAELPPERARDALLAVERMKNLLAGARLVHLFGALEGNTVPLSGAERWLAELLQVERSVAAATARPRREPGALALELLEQSRLERELAEHGGPSPLHLAVLEALRLVGLSPSVLADPTGLRELAIDARGRRSRLICGLDVERARIIAILGEALDRSYYGDSVRFAEAYFRDYLEREQANERRVTP